MFSRRAFIFALSAAPLATSALAQSPEPAALVRQIFETYAKGDSPTVPYTPAVKNKLRATPSEADEILNAQDVDVKEFSVREISRGPDRAVVEARFVSFNRRMVSQFDFRIVDGKWLIADYRNIVGEATRSLRSDLRLPKLN